jgi:hypothetical protein
MIVPDEAYHQGVCAWLDKRPKRENPYIDDVLDPRLYSWDMGWDYANLNYGVRKYGKV